MRLISSTVCTDPSQYAKAGKQNKQAISLLRALPANIPVRLTDYGVPIIDDYSADYNSEDSQTLVNKYIGGIYLLNWPLGYFLLPENREILNQEFGCYPQGYEYQLSGIHRHEEINSLTDEERQRQNDDAERFLYSLGFGPKKEEENDDAPGMFSPEKVDVQTMATFFRQAGRELKINESNSRFLRQLTSVALKGMLDSDPGLISALLAGENMGLLHEEAKIRKGALTIHEYVVQTVLNNLLNNLQNIMNEINPRGNFLEEHQQKIIVLDTLVRDLQIIIPELVKKIKQNNGTSNNVTEKTNFALKEAVSVLDSVLNSLNLEGFGAHDRDEQISKRANHLEDSIYRVVAEISKARDRLNLK